MLPEPPRIAPAFTVAPLVVDAPKLPLISSVPPLTVIGPAMVLARLVRLSVPAPVLVNPAEVAALKLPAKKPVIGPLNVALNPLVLMPDAALKLMSRLLARFDPSRTMLPP